MATIFWSTLTNNQTITFDPLVDVFRFDSLAISAASVQPDSDVLGTNIQLTAGGKTIIFPPGINLLQFTMTNVTFADGSTVLFGDNTTGTANDNNANTLTGTAGADIIGGFGGNDSVNAGGGNDLIFMPAMDGSDGGSDVVDGGAGFDTVVYDGNAAVTVNLLTGTGQQAGGGISTLTGVEAVVGGSFADTLVGDANANSLDGKSGDDTLNAGAGNDNLSGQDGNDTLNGGSGNDNLNGGFGNDTFIFSTAPLAGNADEIADFQSGVDSIRLDASILTGLTQNGVLISTLFAAGAGVATTAAQRILYDTVTGNLNYDADGTGAATAVRLFTLSFGGGPLAMGASDFTVFNGTGSATLLWSTLVDGNTYLFNAATNILNFDDASIRASDRDMLTWTGNDVVFSVGGKANPALNKTVHFTVTGGGRALTDANVIYLNGSKLLIGDNTQSIGNGSSTFDDAANTLTGTAGGDRFLGLGGNDTMDGTGNGDNDVFVLNNGALAFGSDTVIGGAALGDAIGVGTHPSILHGSTVDFSTHTVTSVDGTAAFSNIENAFGTNLADTFLAFDPSRVLTGLSALQFNFDFARVLRGYAGNDTFQGDSRDGYFELVTYSDAPNGVVVNLATGVATDGYDSNLVTAGIQPYTDTLVNIDGVQGSAFNDVLTGGGPGTTFNGMRFEQFEGMAGNDTLDANGATNDRVDYLSSPSGVTVNLATGTASDGWGGTDTLIGMAGVRGSNFDDVITGDANGNFLEGRNGNDFIDGGAGSDSIFYTAATSAITIDLALGSSSLTGGQGTDTWVNIESVRGGDFNDTLRGADGVDNVLEGGAGADLLDGRTGTDVARYDRSLNAVNVNLSTNLAQDGYDSNPVTAGIQSFTDTLLSIERVRGSKFNDTLTGNTLANGFEGRAGNDAINGGTGTDTAEYQNSPGAVSVNLATGTASDGWGGTDTLVAIENVAGSAFDDSLTGDANANSLDGGAGNDTLAGGDGNDTLRGGDGNDNLSSFSFGAAGSDSLFGDAGNDTLFIGGSASAINENVFVDGGAGDDLIQTDRPNNLQNVVAAGGLGIDTYQLLKGENTASYTVTDFTAGAGGDRINVLALLDYSETIGGYSRSSNPFSAAAGYLRVTQQGLDTWLEYDEDGATGNANVFHTAKVLTGVTATALTAGNFVEGIAPNGLVVPGLILNGTAGDDSLAGGYFNDTINGLAGNDTIIGLGGDDTIAGNAGNDVLDGAAGVDTVSYVSATAGVSVSLAQAGAQITGGAGTDTLLNFENLTGSAFADVLTGNTAGNILYGGTGADTLIGGLGNDTYVVDSTADVVTEAAAAGTDLVQSTALAYTLGLNVENLTLLGVANFNGTGNTSINVLTGNSGNNVLNGGVGNDTMVGGLGNDTYVVDSTADVVTEAAAAGTDLVQSTALAYTLGLNVENLTLLGVANINGTGNTSINVLTGNSGNNVLNGGVGNDTMIGGLGNDTYVVDATADVVTEAAAAGTDLVQSTALAYTLGLNVENLTLLGVANINGTGNTSINVLTGNIGNNVLNGGVGNDTMIGGLGNDTYVVDSTADVVTEAAAAGTDLVQSTALAYTLGLNVENLTLLGVANFNGTGNTSINVLTGNSGNNVLNGGVGNDTMVGGLGNDTYVVDSTADVVTEAAAAGTDLVQSTALAYTLGLNVENLTLLGVANINGTGNTSINVLTGNIGNNVLNGGVGNDTMIGGLGNDTYVVDSTADVVTEAAAAGTDLVQSTALAYTLGLNVENLTLLGVANFNGTGNTSINVLTGNSGNNVLNGGVGNDTMVGGLGNDTYVVDSNLDVVTEGLTAGTDLVQSTALAFTLGLNVENLTLLGVANFNGTGNILNNVLTGNSGNNVLNGGIGDDTMIGGLGNDTYLVDSTADVATEGLAAGTDLVQSTALAFTLGLNVENLTLLGAAINGTGNTLINVLTGNSGNNVLNGGVGNDTMIGGLGNDTYVVDSTADVVTEAAAAGTDLVQSSVTYTLTLAANVENLTLTGAAAINGTGTTLTNVIEGNIANNVLAGDAGIDTASYSGAAAGVTVTLASALQQNTVGAGLDTLSGFENLAGSAFNDTLTGDALNNVITGLAGDDTINGGAGADTLIGGAGADVFVFNSKVGSDSVTDFVSGTDTFGFSQAGIGIGNRDTVIDLAVEVAGPGGFDATNELVIVTGNVVGAINAAGAALAIGSANSAYGVGDTRLFVVDNDAASGLFLFTSSAADASVSAAELTLVGVATSAPDTALEDYLFVA